MSRFRLREIRAENYRCFDELTLPIEEDTTVLFAENGGGKTALLSALAMGLAVFQRGSPKTSRLSAARDIRQRTLDRRGAREPAGRCELAWTADVGEAESVTWSTAARPGSGRTTNRHRSILEAMEQVRVPGKRWPLFAWYGVDRLGWQRDRGHKVERMGDPAGTCRGGRRVPRGPARQAQPGQVRQRGVRWAREGQAARGHAPRAEVAVHLLRAGGLGDRFLSSCRALAAAEQSAGIRSPLAEPVPLLLDERHVRYPQGRPTSQGRRRRPGSSLAHRAGLRRVGRFHQPRRDVRPRRRAYGRGDAESPGAGHRRRPPGGGQTAAGHLESQSRDARGGPERRAGQRTDAATAGLRGAYAIAGGAGHARSQAPRAPSASCVREHPRFGASADAGAGSVMPARRKRCGLGRRASPRRTPSRGRRC